MTRKPYEPPAVIHSTDADDVEPLPPLGDPTCDTVSCLAVAVARAHWPGESRNFCEPCANRAVHVAAAMGFKLAVSPL